jgi:hypothetical protein
MQMESLLIQLDEGQIRPPPKLYKEIKDWVLAAFAASEVRDHEKWHKEALPAKKTFGPRESLRGKP